MNSKRKDFISILSEYVSVQRKEKKVNDLDVCFVWKVGKERTNAEWAKTHYGSHQEQKKECCAKYKLQRKSEKKGELAALKVIDGLENKKDKQRAREV